VVPFLNRTVLTACIVAIAMLPGANASAATAAAASRPGSAQAASAEATPEFIAPDDPVKVRDTLAGQTPGAATQSITERLRTLARERFDRIFHKNAAATQTGERTVLFMIPAPHGILYRENVHRLSVNVSLSTDEHPDTIQLYQNVEGQSGRGLVIAPDAKAKGYVQKIDLIQLKTDGAARTSVRGRLYLPQDAFDKADDNFAIVLVCSLEPPYLIEQREHTDPTDEEPTDITRRVSTIFASVQAVWLVNQKDGSVLYKGLSLAR
jgi:hypothetical protein